MNRKHIPLLISILILLTIIWIAWSNIALETNYYTISNNKIPDSFHRFRVALITDLHNYEMGEDNIHLLEILQDSEPDIIVIVGDIVDCYDTDIQIALNFATQATHIAPTYYVTGNHESFVEEYDLLETKLTEAGVVVLHNESIELEENGEYIQLIGLDDPSFEVDYFTGDTATAIDKALEKIELTEKDFNLLLSHRPELFKVYVEHNIDLVFFFMYVFLTNQLKSPHMEFFGPLVVSTLLNVFDNIT